MPSQPTTGFCFCWASSEVGDPPIRPRSKGRRSRRLIAPPPMCAGRDYGSEEHFAIDRCKILVRLSVTAEEDCLALIASLTCALAHWRRPGMAIIVGTGDFKYRIVEDWAKLPDGWSFKEVGAVGVDGKDNVYVFNRGDHPIMVFDRD